MSNNDRSLTYFWSLHLPVFLRGELVIPLFLWVCRNFRELVQRLMSLRTRKNITIKDDDMSFGHYFSSPIVIVNKSTCQCNYLLCFSGLTDQLCISQLAGVKSPDSRILVMDSNLWLIFIYKPQMRWWSEIQRICTYQEILSRVFFFPFCFISYLHSIDRRVSFQSNKMLFNIDEFFSLLTSRMRRSRLHRNVL